MWTLSANNLIVNYMNVYPKTMTCVTNLSSNLICVPQLVEMSNVSDVF